MREKTAAVTLVFR